MDLQKQDRHALMHVLLDFGEMMMTSGAAIHRVEDTITRIGLAYGVKKTGIVVITYTIWITLSFQDGEEMTLSRRVPSAGTTDFIRMEKLNALSRRCCREPITIEELRQELCDLDKPIPVWWLYLGSFLGGGSFAVFFGGGLLDGIIGAFAGLLLRFLQLALGEFCPNTVVFNLVCSFLVGLSVCTAGRLFPILNVETIMVGDIMLLIPGLAMTNALRDILIGDTISGVMRMIECVLWAGGLAGGFMAAMWLIGG